jgi:uncharacterized protein YbaP (TraB family)
VSDGAVRIGRCFLAFKGFLALAGLVAFSAAGESLAESLAPMPEQTGFSRGLLWKVEAKGVAPSYLFGTLHLDDERVLALPEPVKHAFEGARIFAAELLTNETAGRAFRSAMVTQAPQLPALLGEAWYVEADRLFARYGVPTEVRPRLKPWAAMLTLLQPLGATGLILDRVLQEEAMRARKSIHALETVDEQIAAFDALPLETQLVLLKKVIADHGPLQEATHHLVEAYLARDLEALWRLNAQALGDSPERRHHNELFLRRVLNERNARMAERLAPLIAQGKVFAAFGALHLYGEQGVPSLLTRRGFSVKVLY